MNKKAIEKEIDCTISIKNNHWQLAILTLTGSLGLIFTGVNLIKLIFIVIGFIVAGFFFNVYLNYIQKLNDLLKKMEEEDNDNN